MESAAYTTEDVAMVQQGYEIYGEQRTSAASVCAAASTTTAAGSRRRAPSAASSPGR